MPQQARLGSAGSPAEGSGLPLLVLRPDGVVLDADPALGALLGRSAEELAGTPLQALTHTPADVAALEEALHAVRTGTPAGDLLLDVVASGGRPLPLRLAWTVTRRLDRAPTEVTAFVLDESSRRGYDARMRGRFEQSALPQALCDMSATLIEVNEAFCRLLDRPLEEMVGRPVNDLNHRSDPGAADAGLGQLLDGAITAHRYERILAHADGRPVPVLIDATVLRDDDGHPLGAAAFVQDLTQLRSVERRRRQQEEFFLALSRRASDLAIVNDAEGRIVHASPALTRMLGFGAEDVLHEHGISFVHPDDVPAALAMFARVVAEGGAETSELRVRDAAGRWHWVEQTASNLLDTAVGGVVCNLRDISDRVRAEAALRASEARYRAIADNADEGLWLTGPDGLGVYANARLLEILGVPEERVLGRPVTDVLDGAERRGVLALPADGSGRATERYELAWRRPDGAVRILSVSEAALDDDAGNSAGRLRLVSDVTGARQLEDQLRKAALTDPLTGLPNRAQAIDHLQQVLSRRPDDVALLFVDLDRFKIVNDARGHTVGDALLRAVAARLSSARSGDMVARFGGDEFVVVCEGVDESDARAAAGELLGALDDPFVMDGGEAVLSASIGIAMGSSTSATGLLRHADAAMYAAKLSGRSRIRVYDAALASEAEERFELAGDLRRALVREELQLHYQPVIDLRTGEVLGVEGLARWTHPRRGPVGPDRFIPLAEDIGLATRLDRWAMRRAAGDAATLRAAGALAKSAYVAVNVSTLSLGDPGLETWIDRRLESAGLEPSDVVVEITESRVMHDALSSTALLRRLRDRGFGIAVDDFGTGHSSLAYLRDLPLSMLKIDRSFIGRLATDPSSRAIAAAIIDLARAVGVTVVAEGVETMPDAELLRGLGCDAAQGWLWSRAVPPDEAQHTEALSRDYDVTS